MLIYRCGPGALLLFMVLGASLREELPLSVYVCGYVLLSQHERNTELVQSPEPMQVCN